MSTANAPELSPAPLADAEPPRSLAFTVGATALGAWHMLVSLYSLFVRTLYYMVKGRREKGDVVLQMHAIGNQSLGFLCITMGFIGMILVYQSGMQLRRVVPEYTMLGATYMELLVRDLGPSLGALMLATRVGAGIAAEIGSMVVTEQVDALRMSAADPVDFLLVPRFVASLVMTFALIVLASLVAFSTGAVTAKIFFDVRFEVFFNPVLVDAGDMIIGVAKCIAYGAAIPVVSAHAGLATHGGSEGVGWATTSAVVNSSLAILFLNASISAAGFVMFP